MLGHSNPDIANQPTPSRLDYIDNFIYMTLSFFLYSSGMPINVNNPEADALTRKFAHMAGVTITEAIVIAMKEAIAHRRNAETPQQTAARLRNKYGVTLGDQAKTPLPREAFDDMWNKS